MGHGRIVLVLNVLIMLSLIASLGVLGAVVLTAAESAPTLRVGALSTTNTGSLIQFQVPVTLSDRGPLGISDIGVQATVADQAGDQLFTATGPTTAVASGATSQFVVSVSFDASQLPSTTLQRLATTNQNLTVNAVATAAIPPFVTLSGAASAPLQWGAPVSNLQFGAPAVAAVNSTFVKVSVPISFSDNSQFLGIDTTITTVLTNATSSAVVGSGSLPIDVQPGAHFSSSIVIFAKIPSQYFGTLLYSDASLLYDASMSATVQGAQVAFTQSLTVPWGAPVKNLAFGAFSVAPYNSTYAKFSLPVTFTDNSGFLALSGTVGGKVSDASGNQVGELAPLSLSVSPGQTYGGTLSGFLKLGASQDRTFVLGLTFSSQYGSATKQVTVDA